MRQFLINFLQKRPSLAAFVLIVTVCAGASFLQKAPAATDYDQSFYLGIAHDLRQTGRFTDGFLFATPGPDGTNPKGMRFAPLYPTLLAGLSFIDPALNAAMDCVQAHPGPATICPAKKPLIGIRLVQFGELSLTYWLIFWLGTALSGVSTGWLALIFALGSAPALLGNVFYAMTEITCLLWTTLATAAAIRATQATSGRRFAILAGMALGLAALTRPALSYAMPVCGGAALLVALVKRQGFARVAGFWLGGYGVVLPWLLRNYFALGRFSLSFGYASHTLVQRISFDSMSWAEYWHAYICWLPDGNSIGRALFGANACYRFGWEEHPDTFYVIGLRQLLPQTLQAAGGYEHHLHYLLHNYIFRMPLWHVAVSIPFALRGAFIAHWWGFVLFIASLIWSVKSLRQRADPRYLILSLPGFVMLALNAAVAVNQPRYNFMLIPAYAVGAALLVARGLRRPGLRPGPAGGSSPSGSRAEPWPPEASRHLTCQAA